MLGSLLPLVPIGALILLFRIFGPCPIEEALAKAAVVWAAVLVALIEGLSLFRVLTRTNLAIGWNIAFVVIAIYSFQRPVGWRLSWTGLPQPRWSYLAILLTITLPTLIISVMTLPNTWDALTY